METGGSSGPSQNYPIGTSEGGKEPLKRRSDKYMPAASVARTMRRVLPPRSRIADESKEMMQECVSEFIKLVTREANKRCLGDLRKTVSADDLVAAMESLGFDNYVEPLSVYLDMYRAQDLEGIRPTRRRLAKQMSAEPVTLALFPVEPSPQMRGNFLEYGDAAGEEGSSGRAGQQFESKKK